MIPAWNLQGVIPPVRPGLQGHDADRSPYKTPLHTFVDVMGKSHARLEIVEGLLQFRSEIHKIGIDTGFQWLDGSFSENVEMTEGRNPRDVDVVTFLQLPAGEDESAILAKNPKLFDQDYVKKTYQVDSYWDILGKPMGSQSVQQVCYWYSMWSHRRDGMWKGFIQVDLSSAQDSTAVQALNQAKATFGVTP